MFLHADAIVAYHTYPHVDFYQTGARAARLLIDVIDQKVRPVTARVFIPALVRGDELITETGLFGQCIKMAQQAESEPPGLSAGVFIGNPFTDVPELGSYSFVTTNDEPELASQLALEIAERFWEHHERMQVPLISLEQMQQKMSQIGKRQQCDPQSALGMRIHRTKLDPNRRSTGRRVGFRRRNWQGDSSDFGRDA
jgi:microcystin degradation protein MlrC